EANTTRIASCHARWRRRASDRARKTRPIAHAIVRMRAPSGQPGGSTPRMSLTRSAISGVAAETIPMTPIAAAHRARSRSAVTLRGMQGGYIVVVTSERVRIPRQRWFVAVLGGVAVFLVPWILYL